MEKQCCRTCAYASRLRDGRRTLLVCVNCPGALGQLRCVDPDGLCRSFRPKRKRKRRLKRSRPPADEVRYIALTKDRFALVEARDYKRISRFKWSASLCSRRYYAYRHVAGRGNISMHRDIMRPPKGKVVDHTDGNGMNNCQRNMRVCTPMENGHNTRPRGLSSKYKGVSYIKELKVWEAAICIRKKTIRIGHFDTEIEAAHAYDRRALELFGRYAYLNFPDDIRRPRKR